MCILAVFSLLSGCEPLEGVIEDPEIVRNQDKPKTTNWARAATTAPHNSEFSSVAVDKKTGDIYAAGYQKSSGVFDYGTGPVNGVYNGDFNAILVKYNAKGQAQWVQMAKNGNSNQQFCSVAVDNSGNVYVAGYQYGPGDYNYGSGVASGKSSLENALVVKYNADGQAQWARTTTKGTYRSEFYSVAVDKDGNVYAAGYQGSDIFNYGSGDIEGAAWENPVIVKYNPDGEAQWAKTTTGGTGNENWFHSVAVDNSGNLYAAGRLYGQTTLNYGGDNVSVTGKGYQNNGVLVKYDAETGDALWARTTITTEPTACVFTSVAVDSSGDVYVA